MGSVGRREHLKMQSLIHTPYHNNHQHHDPNFLSEGVRFGDLSQDEKAEFT
jgi:hypothetical protein